MEGQESVLESVVNNTTQNAQPVVQPTTSTGRNVLTRKVERELIVGAVPRDTENGKKWIVTTESGKEIWVADNLYREDAEEIRFRAVKKGDKYTYAKQERIVENDSNWVISVGKTTIKQYDAKELQDSKIEMVMSKMAEFGLTNSINL